MTKNDRFKTYAQLEKICRRMLSRPIPGARKLKTEYFEVQRSIAGDTFLKNLQSDRPPRLVGIH